MSNVDRLIFLLFFKTIHNKIMQMFLCLDVRSLDFPSVNWRYIAGSYYKMECWNCNLLFVHLHNFSVFKFILNLTLFEFLRVFYPFDINGFMKENWYLLFNEFYTPVQNILKHWFCMVPIHDRTAEIRFPETWLKENPM